MKRIIYSLFLTSLVIFTSCEKILEVEPTYYISGEEAIKDKRGVETALNGAYFGLQAVGMYGRHLVTLGDLTADNLDWKGTTQEYGQFENNTLLSDNIMVEGVWAAHYDVLNRVNTVLVKLPEISDMTAAEKDNVAGQLYFLRALTHFNLVRLFGSVPVKTQPTLDLNSNLNVVRNTVEDVYKNINSDLEMAMGKISINNAYYASNHAVLALQAIVALYEDDYETAKAKASEVINSGNFVLESDYAALYNGDPNGESIFTVVFDEQNGNRLAEYFYPTSEGGRYEFAPSESLISSYDESDARLAASIQGNPPYCTKYNDLVTMANNVHVIRLAEMYLVRAEAEARLSGSKPAIRNDINIIRERALVDPIEFDTYEELLIAIEDERRRELAFEGKRWFELVRTGRAIEVVESVNNSDQLLFPIPLVEVQNNTNSGMYQNPGY